MMKKNTLFIATGMLFLIASAQAQCTFTGLNATYCENDSPATLTPSGAGMLSGPGISANTFDPGLAGAGVHQIDYDESDPTTYTIDQTGTFAPIPSIGTAVALSDDQVSASLPIGFTFNFFGVNYTNFFISSNGFISFTAGVSNGCCSGGLIPSANGVDNIIAWGWNDLYPPGGGTISYETVGVAPNRMLLVTFTNQWHCCSGPAVNTGQIILYETSNVIEIHNAEITSDGSTNTQGIENATGTIAYATPGRNSTTWTTTNDYVAFYPAVCSSFQSVEVFPSPTVIAYADINPACDGDMVTLTGSGADSYAWDMGVTNGVAFAVSSSQTYTLTGTEIVNGCTGMDVVNLTVNPTPLISLSANDEMMGNDGSINLTILGGPAPYTFDWNNDGIGDNDDSNDLFGVSAGTYTVTITDANGCSTTDSATIGTQVGLEDLSGIEFSIHPNPSNGIFTVKLATENVGNSIHMIIVNTLGQRILSEAVTDQIINVNISDNDAGMYYVKIVSEEGTTVAPIILK